MPKFIRIGEYIINICDIIYIKFSEEDHCIGIKFKNAEILFNNLPQQVYDIYTTKLTELPHHC